MTVTSAAHIDRQSETESARSAEAFWRYAPFVTPSGRRSDDLSKFKLTLRDVLLLLIGCAGMFGAQVARDFGMRSDMRNLLTTFDLAVAAQNKTNTEIQRQIDQWRQMTNLNAVNISNIEREVAELKGILMGAGIKGVDNAKR